MHPVTPRRKQRRRVRLSPNENGAVTDVWPFLSCSKDTAASGSYVGVITITSFFLWYRPIYLGYAKENGLALFFCKLNPLLPSATVVSADLLAVRRILLFRRMAPLVLALVSFALQPSSPNGTKCPLAACSSVSHVSPPLPKFAPALPSLTRVLLQRPAQQASSTPSPCSRKATSPPASSASSPRSDGHSRPLSVAGCTRL